MFNNKLCRGLLLLVILLSATAAAQEGRADTLNMLAETRYTFRDFSAYLSWLEDPGHEFHVENLNRLATADWRAYQREIVDFGFSRSKFWLKIPLLNAGNSQGRWILDLNSRFMNGLDVYLVSDGGYQHLLHDSETSRFSERAIPHRQLATEFSLEAGQQASLIIAYWSRGTTVLPFAIETQLSFYKNWLSDNVSIVAFYSAMTFMIIFGLAQFLILGKSVQLAYALYVAAGCLYVFHMDGLSFKYFWPNWPLWNANSSALIGLNLGVFSILFARSFLNTKSVMPRMDKLLTFLMGLAIAWMLAYLVFDLRQYKQYIFLLVPTNIFFCLLSGLVAWRRGQKDARFYVLGWVGLFLSAVFAAVSHLLEKVLPIPLVFDFAKLGIFVDGIMFAMAMADQANEVRKQRDKARSREKALLVQDLEAQKHIVSLERQYQQALNLAQEKSYTLASAGHDLRQPLVLLKSAMNEVTKRKSLDVRTLKQFKNGFEYIENLIQHYLELPEVLAKSEAPNAQAASDLSGADSAIESFVPAVVLNNIDNMFREEAESKGLEFRLVISSLPIKTNPLALMRILANLTANAIKYTEHGKVLVGCRRRKKGLALQVLDTGPGLSKAEQDNLFKAWERSTEAKGEGYGLGLAIVETLVHENNLMLNIESKPGRGTCFSVLVHT